MVYSEVIRRNDRAFGRSLKEYNDLYDELEAANERFYQQLSKRIGETLLLKGEATHVILNKTGYQPIPVTPNISVANRYNIIPAEYLLLAVANEKNPLVPELILGWPEHMICLGSNGFVRDSWVAKANEIEEASVSEVRRAYADAELVRP